MTAQPPASPVAADAVVNLDGTGTWSIVGGTPEPITATTAAAARDEVLRRAVVAAAERGTVIELTATLAGVPSLLRVSPTGEIARSDGSAIPSPPAPSPGADLNSVTVTNRHVGSSGAASVPSNPEPWRRESSTRGGGAASSAAWPPWAIGGAAGALAVAALAGLVLMMGGGASSPSVSTADASGTVASKAADSRSTSGVAPAVARRELDVTLTARKGGPLTARVRATDLPTVATLTVWHDGRRIATRRLHLAVARTTSSSGTVTFTHTGPGSYRWAATAPGAARVTGRYSVLAKPAPRVPRVQRSTRPVTVATTLPPTQAPPPSAPSAPASPPPAAQPPSAPAPAPAPQAAPHNGPVPGANTSPPHTGPHP